MVLRILSEHKITQPKITKLQEKSRKILLDTYKYRDSLDVVEQDFKEEDALVNYKTFLKDRIKYPTITDMAQKKVKQDSSVNSKRTFDLHKRKLEKRPEIGILIKTAEKKRFQEYSTTVFLREKLIKLGRVGLDEVKPVLKGWKKYFFRIKTWL